MVLVQKKKLINLSRRLNLEDNITFFGFIEDYKELFNPAFFKDRNINYSCRGKGNVVLELFAAELPVILGSDDGIDRDIFKNQ